MVCDYLALVLGVFVSGKVLAILAIYLLTTLPIRWIKHISSWTLYHRIGIMCAFWLDCRRGIAPSQWCCCAFDDGAVPGFC